MSNTLEPEEVQDIIDWAVAASGMVVLMQHQPPHETVPQAIERLNGLIEAFGIMYDNMPDCLVLPAHECAHSAIESAEHDEALVKQLHEDIDRFEQQQGE